MTLGFAQTSLEILRQLELQGWREPELKTIARSYRLAVELMASAFRPSGKQFLHHLVGTASILAWLDQPVEVVAAGMLHSVYEHGDFGLALDRRRLVRDRVDDEIEEIVWRYHRFDWSTQRLRRLAQLTEEIPESDRVLVVMRLANHLEDLLDGGMHYYPDTKSREGSPPGLAPELLAACDVVGLPSLKEAFDEVSSQHARYRIPDVLRGHVRGTSHVFIEDDIANPLALVMSGGRKFALRIRGRHNGR